MLGKITYTILLLLVVKLGNLGLEWRKNVRLAKKSGLPYLIAPVSFIGPSWLIICAIIGPPLRRLPITRNWGWVWLIDRQVSWTSPRAAENKYGDTFLVATPFLVYLKTSSAEVITQITTRKTDFLKPVDRYKIVDIFGRSMLSQEGHEWKRHRRIVAPSFSEKSNRMVFEESVKQAEGMMAFWKGKGNNDTQVMRVDNAAEDAATLSLHVISAAGFGVPQSWPNQKRKALGSKELPGFSNEDLTGSHQMSFKSGLVQLLKQLMWFAVFSPGTMKYSPFKFLQSAYQAFNECNTYFLELLEIKKKKLQEGDSDEGTMDLLGPMIKANYEDVSPEVTKQPSAATLATDEILGNSFIFLFAGHETTANNIHFSLLLLAMNISTQRRMQADIDSILGSRATSEFSYHNDMPRLYNSIVGAVLAEELRLIPAILSIPKESSQEQNITIDDKRHRLPHKTFIHINVVGANRNPRYWPDSPNEFKPERWLPTKSSPETPSSSTDNAKKEADGLETTIFETSDSTSRFKPPKGAFMSFSEGQRSCPGRRFAEVEGVAVLSTIFQKYSVELDVSEWASDEQVGKMRRDERKQVYEKALRRAREKVGRSVQTVTLRLREGDEVPLRFVEKGGERFTGLF